MNSTTIPSRLIWRSSLEDNMERLPRPVYFRSYLLPGGTHVENHRHPFAQFLFARQGTLRVDVVNQSWLIPNLYGIWIPAQLLHNVTALQDVWLESLDIQEPSIVETIVALQVVDIPPFVREYIHFATETVPVYYQQEGKEGRLVNVMLDLLKDLKPVSLSLPLPSNKKLASICNEILLCPGHKESLNTLATRVGMSVRTFSRHFRQETGLTFVQWKKQMRLLQALAMLRENKSVTEVAYSLGYSSVAAFSYAFRVHYGLPPGQVFNVSDTVNTVAQ